MGGLGACSPGKFLQFRFTDTHSEPLLDTFEWLPMGGIGAAYHSCKGFQLTLCLMDITVHCEIVGGGRVGASAPPAPPPPTPTPLFSNQVLQIVASFNVRKLSSSHPASLTSPIPKDPLMRSHSSSSPASLEPTRALRSPK